MILQGNCLEVLKTLETGSVNMCITSPPYCCKKCGETDLAKLVPRAKRFRNICRDCLNKYNREWNAENKDKTKEYRTRNYCNNKKQIIEQKVAGNLRYRRIARLNCINHYSKGTNKCECCGEDHLEFLQIDHINGGGRKHRNSLKRGTYLPLYLKRHGFPDGYRILCANCNASLGFYGYCPHKENQEYIEIAQKRIDKIQEELFK